LGVCSQHYWELKGGRPKQKPLLKSELEAIDPNELWEWVKVELNIKDNNFLTGLKKIGQR
jgi:hypothetical protein